MAKFTHFLVVVVVSVLVKTALSEYAIGRKFNQLGGGRPGFGQVGFGSGICSAMKGLLPDPKSGCCGKHVETDGGNHDNGGDQEDVDGDDNGDDEGYEPGSRDDRNDINDGNVNNDSNSGDDFDNGNGDDFDFGQSNDFDFGHGNEWDSNILGISGNGIGNLDFDNVFGGARWQYSQKNRQKSSTDKNASDVTPDKYIIAGKPAGMAQYPWLVHLNVKIQDMMETKVIGCGGSLISSRHVITAAHCVDFQISRFEDVSIYLAEYNTRTYPTDCVGRQCVKNVIMHPDKIAKHNKYQRDALYNDIAMMRLTGSAPYTDYIRPICLPSFNINSQKYEGTPLTVAGWGQTEYRQPSPVKLHTQVQQVAPSTCKRHYPDLTLGQLCAAGERGQDTCMGDSGGPIMIEREGTFYLVGLVSGKRSDAGCGSSVPTMYTNVFSYTKWIQNFMRD